MPHIDRYTPYAYHVNSYDGDMDIGTIDDEPDADGKFVLYEEHMKVVKELQDTITRLRKRRRIARARLGGRI